MIVSIKKHFGNGYKYFKQLSCQQRIHVSRKSSWRVMFFGTDDFSLASLKRLHEEHLEASVSNLEIVTSHWKRNPVRLFGEEANLTVHEWPISSSIVKKFDIGLVASFGHLIPSFIINAFPLGMLNVHGSILPRWRGAAPVTYSILHGDTEGGITIMRIRPFKFDEGEIVSIKKTIIPQTETASSYRGRLASLGANELIDVLHKLPNILESAVPQPQEGITYAPKLTADLGKISFKHMTARDIFNRYRALCDDLPLTTSWMGSIYRLTDISLPGLSCKNFEDDLAVDPIIPAQSVLLDKTMHGKENEVEEPGKISFNRGSKTLFVQCKGGNYVTIGKIAPQKKRFITALEFCNGFLFKHPKRCWFFG